MKYLGKTYPLFMTFKGSNVSVWCWLLSATLSGLVYPSLYAAALYSAGSATRWDWLHNTDTRQMSTPGRDLEFFKYIFYAFFGYLARDLPTCLDSPLFLLHHVACMCGIISTLETSSPGAIAAAHGILVLELGSCFFNVWSVDDVMRHFPDEFPWWPQWKGPWVSYGYYIGLSLSNVISGYYLYHSIRASFEAGYYVFALWSAVAGSPLLVLRQHEVNKAVRGITPKPLMRDEDLQQLKLKKG